MREKLDEDDDEEERLRSWLREATSVNNSIRAEVSFRMANNHKSQREKFNLGREVLCSCWLAGWH